MIPISLAKAKRFVNVLRIKILPSPSSNDHEARIFIDDVDWLGQDSLGIDPPMFFAQDFQWEGRLLVGRCECGCEGCCDTVVNVGLDEKEIVWTNESGLRLVFDRREYVNEITRASEDFSWEDERRRVERLVGNVFASAEMEEGYVFNWASARIRTGIITVSFTRNGEQKLLEFGWEPGDFEDAVRTAKGICQERIKP